MKKILTLLFVLTLLGCGGSGDDDTNEESQTLRESLDGQVWRVDRMTLNGAPDERDSSYWFEFPEGETSIVQIAEGAGTVNGFACSLLFSEGQNGGTVERNEESVFQIRETFEDGDILTVFTKREGELIARIDYYESTDLVWYCSLTSSTYESMGCTTLLN